MNGQADLEGATQHDTAIRQTRIATGLSYEASVRAFERELGQLDPAAPKRLVERRCAWSEVAREIESMAGPHDLMIVSRVDLGTLTSLSGRPSGVRSTSSAIL